MLAGAWHDWEPGVTRSPVLPGAWIRRHTQEKIKASAPLKGAAAEPRQGRGEPMEMLTEWPGVTRALAPGHGSPRLLVPRRQDTSCLAPGERERAGSLPAPALRAEPPGEGQINGCAKIPAGQADAALPGRFGLISLPL